MSRPEKVLVTGASGGIGSAVVAWLIRDGREVAAAGRDRDRLERLADGAPGAVPLLSDLARPDDRRLLVDRAASALGGLDGLVHCAGVVAYERAVELTESALRTQLEVNTVAPALLLRDFASHCVQSGQPGSVVLVASTLARTPAPMTSAYAASKAALVQLGRSFALEVAPHGIRVNAVLPGVVDTAMVRAPRPGGLAGDAAVQALAKLHPLGRVGTPDDVAVAVLHLLDAPWTTGAAYAVDGGLELA